MRMPGRMVQEVLVREVKISWGYACWCFTAGREFQDHMWSLFTIAFAAWHVLGAPAEPFGHSSSDVSTDSSSYFLLNTKRMEKRLVGSRGMCQVRARLAGPERREDPTVDETFQVATRPFGPGQPNRLY
jgi:hypothetical protein